MSDHDMSRRRLLIVLGGGAATVLAACSKGASSAVGTVTTMATSSDSATTSKSVTAATADASTVSCVLTPEMTEGPYYIDGEANRSDVTEGKPGTPLNLVLPVVDATTCKPIAGATVEMWHADAAGNYSGFGSATSNRTFLRGAQTTDAKGEATFLTIYPGWYQGRATHIHVKVHVGGDEVHTGQLFFDEAVNAAVYVKSPYDTRSGNRTLNTDDGIFSNGGAQSMVALTPKGDGYTGRLVMGVRAT